MRAFVVLALLITGCGGSRDGSGQGGDGPGAAGDSCPGVEGLEPVCADDPQGQTEECAACANEAISACSLGACQTEWDYLLLCSYYAGCFDQAGNLDLDCAATRCDSGYSVAWTPYLQCLDACPALIGCVQGDPSCNTCGMEGLFEQVWVAGDCDEWADTGCAYHYFLLHADGTFEETFIATNTYHDPTKPWDEEDRITSMSSYTGTWSTDCVTVDLKSCGGARSDRWNVALFPDGPRLTNYIPNGQGGWEVFSVSSDYMRFDAALPVDSMGRNSGCE